MSLLDYRKKRKFNKTPEPVGREKAGKELRFFIQEHYASHHHFDFRLELEGVLKSWAVPKGIPLIPKEKRLAVMVEDHPLEYGNFEGIIPKGNYGAGKVTVWDKGNYKIKNNELRIKKTGKTKEEKIIKRGLEEGELKFFLNGNKVSGEFVLARLKNSDKNWLLIKNEEKIKSEIPRNIKPMLATLIDKPFKDKDFLFEIKWDGYRAIAEIDHQGVNLYSRNLQSFNEIFSPIVLSLKNFGHWAVLDGEVVILDKKGKANFGQLQNYKATKEGNLIYYVFDILYLDGTDLQNLELEKRKEILKKILPDIPFIKYSDHVLEKGIDFFNVALINGVEGIIAKKRNSIYWQGKRGMDWLKIKTHLRQEAVIAGFTKPKGSRKKFGALVLGAYENEKLKFIGHTGGGFDEKKLIEMENRLLTLIQKDSPFKIVPKTNTPVTWVKPKLVCEVSFSEWTKDKIMRQPIFLGLRFDKNPKEVKIEIPESKEVSLARSHLLRLTNLNKIFWPREGYKKKDLVDYYEKIAPVILPYLYNRPLTLIRFPNGIEGERFYQKNMEDYPFFIKTKEIYAESENKNVNYALGNNKETLLYLANLGSVEMHPWNSNVNFLNNPDYLVMDLDPLDVSFEKVIKVALTTREIFEGLGIRSFCKTSGATGLHIYVPLNARYTYFQARSFGKIISHLIVKKHPENASVYRDPNNRKGKVYVDVFQNVIGQTMVSAYSLRARPGAPVSTPLKWEEVNKNLNPLNFNIKTIFERLDKIEDIFKDVLGEGIDLEKIIGRL